MGQPLCCVWRSVAWRSRGAVRGRGRIFVGGLQESRGRRRRNNRGRNNTRKRPLFEGTLEHLQVKPKTAKAVEFSWTAFGLLNIEFDLLLEDKDLEGRPAFHPLAGVTGIWERFFT